MILRIEEARDILRLDGTDNDFIIYPLLEAIPGYLEVTTGYVAVPQAALEHWDYSPLARTVAGFLLQLWYNADGTDTEKLQKTINNLLAALSYTVKRR
ncbi:MAG: phage gp6-like head-tail connector protein [Clostridia bacterium]|nr:phage gp6-like head-tail connector protein [Clostridia bacterium]